MKNLVFPKRGFAKSVSLTGQDILVIHLAIAFLEDDIAYDLNQFAPYCYNASSVKQLLDWFSQVQSGNPVCYFCCAKKFSLPLERKIAALLMMAIDKGINQEFLEYHALAEANCEADIWKHRRRPDEALTLDVSKRAMELEETYCQALLYKSETLTKLYRAAFYR